MVLANQLINYTAFAFHPTIAYINSVFVKKSNERILFLMKTETSALPHYSASPLKIIETEQKGKALLRGLKRDSTFKNQPFSAINNSSNDPNAWDASWFSNYE